MKTDLEKEFVPHEQALALKELGFDEPCLGFYDEFKDNRVAYGHSEGYNRAPTFSQAFRGFIEKHGLDNWVYKSRDYAYFYAVLKDSRYLSPSTEFMSHEKAELACLKKLIEIVKNKL